MGSVKGFSLRSSLRLLPGSIEHLVSVEVSLTYHHCEEDKNDEDENDEDDNDDDDLNEGDDDACCRAL